MTNTPRKYRTTTAGCVLGILCVALLLCFVGTDSAAAQDNSEAPILQMFEGQWEILEDRMADIFVAGYGRMWLPPPARADSGGLSVGYDVFDRFDLGKPRDETAYGTENGLKTLIQFAHRAGIKVNTDFIPNHNGFRDSSTFEYQGPPLDPNETADPNDFVTFVEGGGYPGFALTLPNDVDGDFHGAFETGEEFFRLSGLIDIAQEKNHQFIRHPVDPSNPANIPAGTKDFGGRPPTNVPDPDNARFYPDQGLGGTTVFDPAFNGNVTLYDFNTTNPLEGDAFSENATGLLIRNIRWMIQEVGVDGFRFDAGRHFPRWVMNYLDQGAFLAKKEPLLDGSPDHVFSFTEVGFDSFAFQQDFIRKDIDNNNLGQLGGNRDSLDFNFFGAVKNNLTSIGFNNDWRNVKNASLDVNDDGFANNGSQGVAFVQSHDDGPAFLNDVAHAYMLMRPGQAIVYLNADQFDDPLRAFPEAGREDALGGMYGDAITTLVNIRNSHGRGNYNDRTPGGDEKETLIYERESSALVVLSNRIDAGFDSRTVQTSFAPGTPLLELTGNAENATIDPFNDFPEVLVVKSDGTVDLRVPRNVAPDGTQHNKGYFIYGVSGPQGQMRLTDTSGSDLTDVLAGSTPTPGQGDPNNGGPSDNVLNGRTRLTDITIVKDDQFKLRIETDAVNLLGSIRDRHADGDFAMFKVNGGLDLNSNSGVDDVTPGSLTYGFENFTDTFQAGFFDPNGVGLYEQTIDVTKLPEGRNFVTGRVFRHRNPGTFTDGDPNTAGDGGPAVYTDFREVIYVDRLPPEAAVVSFEPFAGSESVLQNRDLIVESTDKTADNMHFFLDLPAGLTDAEVLALALSGQNDADEYDRDQWIFGFFGVTTGNHVATVVTFEETFDGTNGFNVQRFSGVFTDTGVGAGFGDLDADNSFEVSDIQGASNGSFEDVLYSQNSEFNAAADVNGDGEVDNLDLFALGNELTNGGASQSVMDAYFEVLLDRGDINDDGMTNGADVAALHAAFGTSSWLADLNVDGTVDILDVQTLITDIARTVNGDFDLDRDVDGTDFLAWQRGTGTGNLYSQGDADLNGVINGADLSIWNSLYGTTISTMAAASTVPEPGSAAIAGFGLLLLLHRRERRRADAPSHKSI